MDEITRKRIEERAYFIHMAHPNRSAEDCWADAEAIEHMSTEYFEQRKYNWGRQDM